MYGNMLMTLTHKHTTFTLPFSR